MKTPEQWRAEWLQKAKTILNGPTTDADFEAADLAHIAAIQLDAAKHAQLAAYAECAAQRPNHREGDDEFSQGFNAALTEVEINILTARDQLKLP